MLLQRVVAAVFLICELIVPAALFTISYKALKERGKTLAVADDKTPMVCSQYAKHSGNTLRNPLILNMLEHFFACKTF